MLIVVLFPALSLCILLPFKMRKQLFLDAFYILLSVCLSSFSCKRKLFPHHVLQHCIIKCISTTEQNKRNFTMETYILVSAFPLISTCPLTHHPLYPLTHLNSLLCFIGTWRYHVIFSEYVSMLIIACWQFLFSYIIVFNQVHEF